MLLKGSPVPGTRLVAARDWSTGELLRILGPTLGRLYEELASPALTPPPGRSQQLAVLLQQGFTPTDQVNKDGVNAYVTEYQPGTQTPVR